MKKVNITCDVCEKDYTDNTFELQEFTHIKMFCGYGSVFGDGNWIECDICQNCLKEKFGQWIRITDEA